jgi:hypothetical protein
MKFLIPLVLLAAAPFVTPLAAQNNSGSASGASNPPTAAAPPAANAGDDNPSGLAGPPPPVPPQPDLEIPPPALSPDPFSDPLISKVVVRYQKAWDGNKKETQSLTADLDRWSKDEPNNYLLLAYLGSVYALDSRDSFWPPSKLDYLKKGQKAMDDAVNGDPSNPAVRLLRAMDYYELPAMFGKHRAAYDDFQYLTAQLKGTLPMPYTLSTDSQQAIYYYSGLSEAQFDHPTDAKQAWQTGVALAPKSKLAAKMQAELAKLK